MNCFADSGRIVLHLAVSVCPCAAVLHIVAGSPVRKQSAQTALAFRKWQIQISHCISPAEEPAGLCIHCVASVMGPWAVDFQKLSVEFFDDAEYNVLVLL